MLEMLAGKQLLDGADLLTQPKLDHASLETTERYLGTALCLANAPCDKLGLA